MTQRGVDPLLAPLLARGAAPRAAELLDEARSRVETLVRSTSEEERYMEDVLQGSFGLERLLPDDPETAQRLARHPAVLWKILNTKEHRAPSRSRRKRLSR